MSSAADAGGDVDVSAQVWREVVDVDLPTFGTLVSKLADEAGIHPDDADDVVDQAIADGTLTPNGESVFGPTYEVRRTAHVAKPIRIRVGNDGTHGDEWIRDPGFAGSTAAVREHYRRARPVYEAFSDLDGCPTAAFAGNSGWYCYRYENDLELEDLEAGHWIHRRAYTIERDFEDLIEGIERDDDDPSWRSFYNIVSWKDAEAVYAGAYAESFEDYGSGDGLAGYRDMRGFPLWVDLDLEDNDDGDEGPNFKRRRGALDHHHRTTVEAAIGAYIEEFADLYGVDPERIAAFDSGGGAYLYGPATATIPIAERYADDEGTFGDARELIFEELRLRMAAYGTGEAANSSASDYGFSGIETRVNERVDGAAELLNPDWLQNRNRQSKAPLSIHKDHDIVVSPIHRDGAEIVDYSPTRVSEVDDDLIDQAATEARKIVDLPGDGLVESMTESFIGTLFPDYEGDGWREILDTWLADERERRRDEAHQRALAERQQRDRHADRDDLDEGMVGPEALAGMPVTSIQKDVYDALDSRQIVDVRDVVRDHACDEWNTSNRGHETTFNPSWRKSSSGKSCAIENGANTFVDSGAVAGGGPAKAYALGTGILPSGENAAAHSLTGKKWAQAIDGLRADGYSIPVYVPEAGSENADGETYEQTPLWAIRKAAVALGVCDEDGFVEVEGGDGGTYDWFADLADYNETLRRLEDDHDIETGRDPLGDDTTEDEPRRWCEECEPPISAHAEPLDIDARRDAMTGTLYDAYIDRDKLTVWAHNPGEGKTTSAALAAAERERKHVVLLPKHENCREFQRDEKKPGGYMHLKGAAQPVGNGCMDAAIDDDDCSEHGHPSNCPTMCPVYSELDADHPTRQAFDTLAGSIGVQKAHMVLGLTSEGWHGKTCDWMDQWNHLESADRVVTVHNYLRMKSVREHGDIIIDDLQGALIEDGTVQLKELSRCRDALRTFSDVAADRRTKVTLLKLAAFVEDLITTLSESAPEDAILDDVPVPEFTETYTHTFDDVEDVPDHVRDEAVEVRKVKEYVGEGRQYVYNEVADAEMVDIAEALAQAKRMYNDTLIERIKRGKWSDTPFCLDTVFAALAAAGVDSRACRVAAGPSAVLDRCPRCDSRLGAKDGARMCTATGCGWNEREDRLTYPDSTPARIDALVATSADGVHGITTRQLPSTDELPDPSNVLVLDATPRKDEFAGVFGTDAENVTVDGDDAYSLPHATVTQIVDGAYHRSTFETSETARGRAQRAIDRVNDMHDDVVYVTVQKVEGLFDWPEDAEVLGYYALRGLDRPEADAIVCVGAPHPAEDDLRADARVLAVDNPRVRVGGRELSTRQDEDAGAPVWRKLNYIDGDGQGRAVASKTYTGLTGELFDGRHADEIEQAAHRNRPILATEDAPKHVYLFTNVATQLPIDRLTSYDAFLDPIKHRLDVRDSALELLETMADIALDPDTDTEYATEAGTFSIGATGSEWHEAVQEAGMNISRPTVTRGLDELRDAGLVEDGEYVQRRGRLHTLTELGARVAASR